MTVYAAGALLWREENDELLVAVIHRARYNDWGWPKGKVDPGETLPETAVREIKEETGLTIRLGVKLGVQEYQLPNGKDKEVHYWAARVSSKALKNSTFKPSEEVAKVDWMTPNDARKVLSYPHDLEFLAKLEELHKSGSLRTKPVIVLRHGKAMPRDVWGKNEETRPLLPAGKRQAEQLAPLLEAWAPKRIHVSPWTRCKATVEPYAKRRELELQLSDELTEAASAKHPDKTLKRVHRIMQHGDSAVICSHRPAIPVILQEIAKYQAPAEIAPISSELSPGEFLVIHLTVAKPGKSRRIVAIEKYRPLVEEKK